MHPKAILLCTTRGIIMQRNSTDAFDHYIRTGERLTDDDWQSRFERKFNHHHDPDNGRFTFGPGGPKSSSASGRRTATVRQEAAGRTPRVRPIVGFPETGKDTWRKAHDAIFERAADQFNAENGLKPGDARYMDPQLMKAWAMVESGGSKAEFLSDPFQVNKRGDWNKAKKELGLSEGKAPGATLGSYAALRWLDMKGHRTTFLKNGTKVVVYRGLPAAFMRYNANARTDQNGRPHYENYVEAIKKLYHGS